MVIDAGLGAIVFLITRILFGGLLLYQGLNHFLNTDAMAEYAESPFHNQPRASHEY